MQQDAILKFTDCHQNSTPMGMLLPVINIPP